MLVHVLAIESISYTEVLATACDDILKGCTCGKCGSDKLKLTDRWVGRGLQRDADDFERLKVRLASCRDCEARERILPYDALPGKRNNVQNIFGAVSDVLLDGMTLTAAAEKHGVSRACVRKWLKGLGPRFLDLWELYRHRAVVVPVMGTNRWARLIRFWSFISEAVRYTGRPMPGMPERESSSAKAEAREMAQRMVELCQSFGGAMALSRVGAELFHQAVLLFRGDGLSTRSSVVKMARSTCLNKIC